MTEGERRGLAPGSSAVVLLGLLATCVLALAACSSNPTPSGAPSTSATSTPDVATATAEAPSPTPSRPLDSASRALLSCLQGTWTLVSFSMSDDTSVTSSGQGGDVSVEVTGQSWTLTGDGLVPMTVSVSERSARAEVDGSASGRIEVGGKPERWRWSTETVTGDVRIRPRDAQRSMELPLTQFAAMALPQGDTRVECGSDRATITSTNTSVNQHLVLDRD